MSHVINVIGCYYIKLVRHLSPKYWQCVTLYKVMQVSLSTWTTLLRANPNLYWYSQATIACTISSTGWEDVGDHLGVRKYFPLYPTLRPSHPFEATWICISYVYWGWGIKKSWQNKFFKMFPYLLKKCSGICIIYGFLKLWILNLRIPGSACNSDK